jgi:hypothetical protein
MAYTEGRSIHKHKFPLAHLTLDTHAHTNLGIDEHGFPCSAFILKIKDVTMEISTQRNWERSIIIVIIISDHAN